MGFGTCEGSRNGSPMDTESCPLFPFHRWRSGGQDRFSQGHQRSRLCQPTTSRVLSLSLSLNLFSQLLGVGFVMKLWHRSVATIWEADFCADVCLASRCSSVLWAQQLGPAVNLNCLCLERGHPTNCLESDGEAFISLRGATVPLCRGEIAQN